MNIIDKFSLDYYDNCIDLSEILSDLTKLSDIDEKPAVYGLYIRSYPQLTPLYIGSTNNMWRRFIELIGFNHTFTRRLYLRLLEKKLNKEVSEKEADELWYTHREIRLKVIQTINKLFKHVCIKIEYVESEDKARELEQELISKYTPLNPHYKKKEKELEKILRFIRTKDSIE